MTAANACDQQARPAARHPSQGRRQAVPTTQKRPGSRLWRTARGEAQQRHHGAGHGARPGGTSSIPRTTGAQTAAGRSTARSTRPDSGFGSTAGTTGDEITSRTPTARTSTRPRPRSRSRTRTRTMTPETAGPPEAVTVTPGPHPFRARATDLPATESPADDGGAGPCARHTRAQRPGPQGTPRHRMPRPRTCTGARTRPAPTHPAHTDRARSHHAGPPRPRTHTRCSPAHRSPPSAHPRTSHPPPTTPARRTHIPAPAPHDPA